MRFKTKFSRWVGGGGTPALGSDSAPTTAVPDPLTQTNLLQSAPEEFQGEPAQRVAITYHGPALAPILPANAYLYEENSARWYKLNSSPISLTAETVTFIDVPVAFEEAARKHGTLTSPGGDISIQLVVADPGGTPNGEYVFTMSPNMSSPSSFASGGAATHVIVDAGVTGSTPVPVSVTGGLDRTATGSITSTQTVAVSTQACGSAGLIISGTWTGTIVVEGSVDGSAWSSVNAVVPTTGAEVTSITANGTWIIGCAGYQQIRVRGNTVGTGSATATLNSSTATETAILVDSLPAGSNTIGATIVRGGAKGTSAEANATTTPLGANHQGLDVSPTQYHATTPALSDLDMTSLEVGRRGILYIISVPRHIRHIPMTAAGTSTTFGPLVEGSCDVIRTDTDGTVVYMQLPESPWNINTPNFTDASKWTVGAGWAIDTVNKWAAHTAGSTASLSQDTSSINPTKPIVTNDYYLIATYVTDRTAGSVTPYLGTTGGSAITANGWNIQVIQAQSAVISLTPTTDFDGKIATPTGSLFAVAALPSMITINTGSWECFPAYLIGGVAASATPGTLSTSIRIDAGWLRRAGATNLG